MKKIKLKKVLSIFTGALVLFWLFLTIIDFIRFLSSDSYISPLIFTDYIGCGCYEWREECGIGYSFDYTFDSEEDLENKKYFTADFKVFGYTLHSK